MTKNGHHLIIPFIIHSIYNLFYNYWIRLNMTTGIVKAEVALNLPKQKAEVDITN